MGTIRVEYVPVATYKLGFFGLDHLQIVYEDETSFVNEQDYWYVIEGAFVPSGDGFLLGAIGEDGRTTLAVSNLLNRDDLVAKIGTPGSRGSRIILTNENALALWDEMAAYAGEVEQQGLPYIAASLPYSATPTINSNSLVASVLHATGFDLSLLMPFGVRFTPGSSTLIGTTEADNLSATPALTTVLSGFGDDTLSGTNNLLYVDRLYGGYGNDSFGWSAGENLIHGGQPGLDYTLDGFDTVDYSGAGHVSIYAARDNVDHKSPDFIAVFDEGSDRLFSIEQISWNANSDVISLGQGVELLERPVKLDLGGEQSGLGDLLDLSGASTGVFINAFEDYTIVQAAGAAGSDAGFWAQSAEWVIGSNNNDTIYAAPTLHGVEAGAGDDVIDLRLSAAFAGGSPQGYDIEVLAGAGNDTIVSGAGRTIATGGDGSDTFVLSAMTSNGPQVEFVITDADANDRLLVPYNFFGEVRGGYDGSSLMQVLGAPFAIDDNTPISIFEWGPADSDQVHGYITFVGLIFYERDGDDLIINLFQGNVEEFTDPEGQEVILSAADGTTWTRVRVVDWQDGDLGITFPLTFDPELFNEAGSLNDYPGWLDAVQATAGPGGVIPALDARPPGHLPFELQNNGNGGAAPPEQLIGSNDGDVIIATAFRNDIDGKGGDDDITGGDGSDHISGGMGDDTMRGGRGNDTYVVDSAGDSVIEVATEGFDRIRSSVSLSLPEFVEHLVLTGDATVGTGNALNNTIEGSANGDTLSGLGGDDTLAGGAGDDILIGGSGRDGYVYARGDGYDTVIDAEDAGELGGDWLIFADDIRVEDISFISRSTAPEDLVLKIDGGGSVTLADFFNGGGVTYVQFADGTVWSRANLEQLAQLAVIDDNDAPQAADDFYLAVGAAQYEIDAELLLGNDLDHNADELAIISVSDVSSGTLSLDVNGNLLFAPDGDEQSVSFTYTVSDGNGGTATARVELALIDNEAPVITPVPELSVAAGQAVEGTVVASDADGDTLAYAVKPGSGPLLGSVIFTEDGQFTYTANAGASGTDTFVVLVIDGLGGVAETTISVDVGSTGGLTISGTSADETLTGSAGNDIFLLTRNGGTDQYLGGAGFDEIRGSTRNDLLRVVSGLTNLTSIEAIDLGAGSNDRIVATTGDDTIDFSSIRLAGVEAIEGRAGNDTITGTTGADRIVGGSGNDILSGGAGDDAFLVRGNSGLDSYNGGEGSDAILGSDGDDTLVISNSTTGLISIEAIDLGAGTNDRIVGTSSADVIDLSVISVAGAELINGLAGDDIITGTSSNDVIAGGSGNDQLFGGEGDDIFLVDGNSGLDVVNGGLGFDTWLGSDGNDTFRIDTLLGNLASIEAIDGAGGSNDRIVATSGNDFIDLSAMAISGIEGIHLGAGDDTVTASVDNDVLYGGGGRDHFVFKTDSGHDIIADFAPGRANRPVVDVIELSGLGFASAADALAAITDSENGAVLSTGEGSSITFEGLAKADLRADHFLIT